MISVTSQGELIAKLEQAPAKLRRLVAAKMAEAMEAAYKKAVLQFSAGKYSSTEEVTHGVDVQGSLVIGWIEPVTEKAKVQEFGGKGYYRIFVGSKGFLANREKNFFTRKDVYHPPAQAKNYILKALQEQMPLLETELAETWPETFR